MRNMLRPSPLDSGWDRTENPKTKYVIYIHVVIHVPTSFVYTCTWLFSSKCICTKKFYGNPHKIGRLKVLCSQRVCVCIVVVCSSQPLCDNHDDGETQALILCDHCGNLCGECDRVLHYSKKNNKDHQRQVSQTLRFCPGVTCCEYIK